MIRKLLATTALATLVATGAMAQDATAPATTTPPTAATEQPAAPAVSADGHLASNIIGETVYNGTAEDAQNIGKVTDLVLDKDGNVETAVIGVGGFLGLGAKDVTFDFDKMQWAEKDGDRWLIAAVTKEALEAQPAFDSTPYKPAPATERAPGVTTTDTVSEAPAATAPVIAPAEGNLASLIIGESVYNGTGDEALDIGKVNDVVLSPEGKAQSLVIGVGGFLGMGQKNVAFDFDKATWAERDGDRWLVVEATKESLEALPDFDRRAYDVAPVTSADNSAAAPAAVPETDTAAAPKEQPDATSTAAIDKSTLTEVQMTDVSAKELDGTTVYGADDVKVGEIGDAVLTPDGQVDAVIIDVGGFLGIGSKPVAVGMDTFRVMADKDGKKYLYTEFTKEQLEAHPAYDKDSYADNREQQRLMVR
ncbi:sporulation protein YlmC with PRC-barrel domain [Aquamicrobium lusatiense]|uniref:Sporulation protein YlmC with PRC-barrel domain n=1 Tax=Aquamicrobium lusatiense TaxID=89772 RepID=A0A7W9VSF9_9HYPH|nr:PRC-barrel domain-containing protein [Aquamicrobium lusatiense]MBB6010714.1 sporulation protein YlmC with PRC-barrel domain [Aquamicrobium lusatiense]